MSAREKKEDIFAENFRELFDKIKNYCSIIQLKLENNGSKFFSRITKAEKQYKEVADIK